MSRRLKLPTRELGELKLIAIRESGGLWEPEWEPVRGTLFGDLFSTVSKEDLDHALNGWSWPLVQSLGLSPEGALIKVPLGSRQCYRRSKCSLYIERDCHLESKRMPWCFEPDGVAEENIRKVASKVIEEWRQGVYLIVILEEADG
jgi:hypothetical protein